MTDKELVTQRLDALTKLIPDDPAWQQNLERFRERCAAWETLDDAARAELAEQAAKLLEFGEVSRLYKRPGGKA